MSKDKKSAKAKAVKSTTKSVNKTKEALSKIPEEKKINFGLDTAKDIIDDFIKQCANLPGCLALAMRELSNEYAAKMRTIASQEAMAPEDIIEDAEVIFATMGKLRKDYDKEHDHANAVFDEILGHYVPSLQKALRQSSEEDSASEAEFARNQELEVAKGVVADFVKTCSLHPDSKKSAVVDLANKYLGQRQFQKNQKAISPDTIIADATKITAAMEKLVQNSGEVEQAYKVMDDILSRYIPELKLAMENNMKKK